MAHNTEEPKFYGFPKQGDHKRDEEILLTMRRAGVSDVVILKAFFAFAHATKEQADMVAKKLGINAVELHTRD